MNLRLNWEIFKEEWPYLKSDPVSTIQRWLRYRMDRPERHRMINKFFSNPGICRRIGESDDELRERIKNAGA